MVAAAGGKKNVALEKNDLDPGLRARSKESSNLLWQSLM